VRNVRNFRYSGSEEDKDTKVAYYDKTYDLTKIKKVWYITEPFGKLKAAAHTFLSFEFENGDFLSITVEARKLKGQEYSLFKGLLRTYPLMYIAADERDVVVLRANIRKSDMYVYPVKLKQQENARLVLEDILNEMNDLAVNPDWYNTFWDNCTSRIAYHINRISPGRLTGNLWQLAITGYADELALKKGLLDTDLSLEEARKKYFISKRSREIGPVDDYSRIIRQFSTQ
jgi:hypothetical protein